MELGNAAFGNSRGNYPVDRGLQDIFHELLIEPFGFNGYGYPEDEMLSDWTELPEGGYTNGTFIFRQYFWGDCQCGWDDVSFTFDDSHSDECYRTKLDALHKQYGEEQSGGFWHVPWNCKPYKKARTLLCKEMGLDPDCGCEAHCTCDNPSRYKAWFDENKLGEHGHKDTCRIILPNFECPEVGLKIKWYKYALRDSYSNIPLNEQLIRTMARLIKTKKLAVLREK
jgi:hypothetical protein